MKGIKPMTDIDQLCEELKELTDCNLHTEAYAMVAAHFEFKHHWIWFNDLMQKQTEQGFMNCEQSAMRYERYKIMIVDISLEYDVETSEKIRACL